MTSSTDHEQHGAGHDHDEQQTGEGEDDDGVWVDFRLLVIVRPGWLRRD